VPVLNFRTMLFATCFAFTLFAPAIFYGYFIFDDASLIYKNDLVVDPSLMNFIGVWLKSNTPLITNVWQLTSYFFGTESATPFRILNIVFHIFNIALVYAWSKIFITKIFSETPTGVDQKLIERGSLVAMLVFAIHPVQVESVVWVSSLKEVLATTFALLSFITYFKKEESGKVLLEVLSVFLFVLGILTHPTIAALPLVYIWLDYTILNKSTKEVFYRNGIYIILLLAAVIIHKTVNPQVDPSAEQPLYVRLSVAMNALVSYLDKTILPLKYSFDYMMTSDYVAEATKSDIWPKAKAFMSGLGLWGILLCYKRKNLRYVYYSLLTFVVLVSVNLGIVEYAFQNISTIADRFLYFPIIGFALFLACLTTYGSAHLARWSQRLFAGVLIVYLVVMVGISFKRVALWRTSGTLLGESLKNGFESYPLNIAMGVSLLSDKQYLAAIQFFEKALDLSKRADTKGKVITPTGDEAYSHMFEVYKQSKDRVRGMFLYNELTTKVHIPSPELSWKIAEYLIEMENWFEAEKHIKLMAARYAGTDAFSKANNSLIMGRFQSVINSYVSLGIFEMHKGNHDQANSFFKSALDIKQEYGLEHFEIDDLIQHNANLQKSVRKKLK
jgi:tetratricopeptide (TPR) repeat protein